MWISAGRVLGSACDASLNINQRTPVETSFMNHPRKSSTVGCLTLFALLFAAFPAMAGNTWETAPPLPETLLYTFSNTGDGAYPGGGMILGSDGNFWGTTCGTAFGAGGPGATSYGTVFKMAPDGTLATVYTFTGAADGNCPDWELAEGPDGNFYGVTSGGNATTPYGTIFKVTPAGSLTTLYTYCGTTNCLARPKSPGFIGQQPALILGNDGNFWGTSQAGGSAGGCGSVIKITPSGTLSVVYTFTCGADGGTPEPALVLGADGNFYGTAKSSADATSTMLVGEVFKLTPSGTLTVLHEFCSSAGCSSDYGTPVGAPVLGHDNNLYGVANFVSGAGMVYEVVTATGAVNAVASPSFNFEWTMRLAGQDGNIYGGGEDYAFQYTPGGGIFFWNGTANTNPIGGLIGLVQDGKGNFYGQSSEGGSNLIGSIFTATLAASGVTLTASPTSITLGQPTTLTWSSTDETSCTAGGAWSGSESTSGTQIVTPTATGMNSYTLTCTGTSGTANATATVSVAAPLPTVNISVTPTSITLGKSATLNWSSTNATTCTASNGWTGTKATSGTQSVTPTQIGTSNYTLTCTGAGGTLVASAALTVTNPPLPTITLSVTPTSITLGQSATLNWSSTNATTCTASNGWTGTMATAGTQSVTPTQTGTSTYTLTCNGAGGTLVASAALTVNSPPPPTVTLSVAPTSITLGQSATLNWSSTHATSCTASNGWSGSQNTSGTLSVTPSTAGTETYTLTCSATGSTSTVTNVTLTVTAPAASASGHGGGGSLGVDTILGLTFLLACRARRKSRPGLSAQILID
jgi:uncharacterized repeat protein (TIGR03803 family)